VAVRKKNRQYSPFIQLQCLMFSYNEEEVSSMKQLARDLGADQLVFKTAQILNPLEPAMQVPKKPEYSRYLPMDGIGLRMKKVRSGLCFRMWSTAVITWDGRMVPCCYDKEAEFSYGSLTGAPFAQLWRSTQADYFRRSVKHNRQAVPICRNCPEA
jgi:radical SAM protein with 4Fe4S-binding SPASM domain